MELPVCEVEGPCSLGEADRVGFADLEGKTACNNRPLHCAILLPIYGAWMGWAGIFYEYNMPETKYVTLIARSKDPNSELAR
jgi:hypothetical protein